MYLLPLCVHSFTKSIPQNLSGMVILELSSYLLEIPNDTYTTLSQFWLAAQHSVKSILQAVWLILEYNEKAT